MEPVDIYDLVPVPRAALRLPVEVPAPRDFDPARLETWPRMEGRLEFVDGRLLYMPPTGGRQTFTCADVVGVLRAWRKTHTEFVVGGNEAGVRLGGDTRGIDAAVWRKADLPQHDGGLIEVPPVLAVEVAGRYDDEAMLREKARWYLHRGVAAVWLLFPVDRRAIVTTSSGDATVGSGEQMPVHAALPDFAPAVDELFEQVSG